MLLLRCRAAGADRAMWLLAFIVAIPMCAHGFYLPGVAPTDYLKGEELNPKVKILLKYVNSNKSR